MLQKLLFQILILLLLAIAIHYSPAKGKFAPANGVIASSFGLINPAPSIIAPASTIIASSPRHIDMCCIVIVK